ncbi:MAG: hypothetical protein AAF957_13840 [Planctomycetota bacterium]
MTTVGPEPPFLPLRILGAVLRWAPVWVPALLFWQITTGGLQPALAERSRLDGVRPEVEARHSNSQAEFERMAAERRAWEDPVYQERRRRATSPADEPADGLSRGGG